MAKKEIKKYYAVIMSVGYGVYDDWDKVEKLRKIGFHKKGSNYFYAKKFSTFYEAARYILEVLLNDGSKCNSIHDFVIPTIVNEIYFYSHLGYLSMDELVSLQQVFSHYQEASGNPALYQQSAGAINLVRFDGE